MAKQKASEAKTYDLRVSYEPRVVSVLLGAQKYTTPARALAELVANALDAGATLVSVTFEDDDLGVLRKVEVRDNGCGITPDLIKQRIAVVGVSPLVEIGIGLARMGRFGVGRLAVHRLGSVSTWSTTAKLSNGDKVKSAFTLCADQPTIVKVSEASAPRTTPTGTVIAIEEIKEGQSAGLTPARIGEELLVQFCGYLLANPGRRIEVQGEGLDVAWLVQEQTEEPLTNLPKEVEPASMRHVLLHRSVDRSRFPNQVILTAKGRTVRGLSTELPLSPNYLGIAECPYLDNLVTSNRESLIEFDPLVASLAENVLATAKAFDDRLLSQRQARFIEAARQKDFYPYREAPRDSVTLAEQAVYDVVLERIHENANLEAMSKRQQAVVFKLLKRALENEDLLAVLGEVATLSDEDVERFREVLARTTLDSIIRLSSEVTGRLQFLDMLHELVYGDVSKHLKERSQLHKILEPKAWLFGPRFHLATSDRNFREVIRRHRQIADLPSVPDDVLKLVKGGQNIPDLFLAATKDYPSEPKHHHLLVELKAPKVPIGTKELLQARKYANTILDSSEFDKRSASWDIFLVSAEVSNEVERDRRAVDRPFGCVLVWESSLKVWVFQWSEIITAAREEMHLVRDHLRRRSEELSVSEYLKKEFPEIADMGNLQEAS
jgi:hypothetical protein